MTSNELRRAALTLHALAEPDRDWVLRRLDTQQQRQVQQHLGELQALGIAADSRLVEQALQQGATVAEPQWRNALRGCDPQRVHDALRGEPAALIARVLNNGPWPWEKPFLTRLDKLQRARVAKCRMQELPASRELDESLLRALAERLALPEADAPAATTRWPRVWKLFAGTRRPR
jgi:hypothetical protein